MNEQEQFRMFDLDEEEARRIFSLTGGKDVFAHPVERLALLRSWDSDGQLSVDMALNYPKGPEDEPALVLRFPLSMARDLMQALASLLGQPSEPPRPARSN